MGWGNSEKRKITWVRWEVVCKPREEGGLGIKNLDWFNLALLGKWRWTVLKEENGLWKQILVSRYGVETKGDAALN